MNRPISAILSGLVAAITVAGANSIFAGDSPGLDLARQLNDAFVSVADKVIPSVVVVEVTEKPTFGRRGPRIQEGQGSGIIVSADGYILTNCHVVDNAAKILVILKNGRSYDADIVGTNEETDIAVIKIHAKGLPVARLGDSDKMRPGEFVIAIGHPFEMNYSVTVGHVSAVDRIPPASTPLEAQTFQPEYIQTDAQINPGNSGGPLVNLNGEVIGINSMIYGMRTGIGLSIPINEAKIVEKRLISDGKFTRSWIGISMAPDIESDDDYSTTPSKPIAEHVPGVEVQDILPTGPSAKSGLKPGDIILAVNGAPVKTDRELKNDVTFTKPGQTITLNVSRDHRRIPIRITTAEVPQPPQQIAGVSNDYGFSALPLNKDLAGQLGVKADSGVVVTEVEMFSPAYDRQLEPGDVINKINDKDILTMRDLRAALRAVTPGEALKMELTGKTGSKMKILRLPAN